MTELYCSHVKSGGPLLQVKRTVLEEAQVCKDADVFRTVFGRDGVTDFGQVALFSVQNSLQGFYELCAIT